jgi:hypothetical protein
MGIVLVLMPSVYYVVTMCATMLEGVFYIY